MTVLCVVQCAGIFTLSAKQVKSKEFLDFEKAWYSQPSTATMSENGTRSKCSDAKDATGRYIWREDGKKEGRCCGIDFEKAEQKRRANKCSNDDLVCASAAISTYVPFAYDAGIALAHGLHELVHRRGLRPDKITADLLSQAMKISTFEGVTGPVSFESDSGDRQSHQFEWVVYNYHEKTPGFKAVGRIVNGNFTTECADGPCTPLVFSDGSSVIPVVRDQ